MRKQTEVVARKAYSIWRETGSLRETAKRMGCSHEWVRQLIYGLGHEAEIRRPPKGSRPPPTCVCKVCGKSFIGCWPSPRQTCSDYCRSTAQGKPKRKIQSDEEFVAAVERLGRYGTARIYGLSYTTVYLRARRLVTWGVLAPIKPRPPGRKAPPLDRDAILSAYANGSTLRQIRDTLGGHFETIRKIVLEAGITRRR